MGTKANNFIDDGIIETLEHRKRNQHNSNAERYRYNGDAVERQ